MQTDKDLADELRSGLASMAAHASVDMELWGYFSNDVLKAASRLEARSEVIAETSHNPLSSGEAVATDDVVRDMTGESVCGYRVAAWRETHPEHGDKFGHRYSEHWSTPSTNPAVKVERLFTESQLRAALSRPMPSREEVARKIDPEAWEEYLLEDGRVDEEVASIFQDAYEVSLVKADQVLRLFSASLGGREDTASRVTDSGRGALPTPPEGSERPISPLRVLADDGPEWQAINALFVRHGLEPPPVRLRDELVNHLAWAKFGAAQVAHAAPVPQPFREAISPHPPHPAKEGK